MKHLLITAIALAGIWWPAAPAHSIAPDDFLRLDGQQLVVPRTLLGVPLLLAPTLVEGTFATEPQAWVVWTIHFQQIGNGLQLVADPVGTSANATERTPIILGAFPIRHQSASGIIVDFHSIVLDALLREWTAFIGGTALEANVTLLGKSATADHRSYIRTSTSGPGWFTLEQVLGVQVGNENHGAVVRWTFWREDVSTLEPLLDDPEDQWGYLSRWRFTPGDTTPQRIIHRFDPARPVTFYLSANMPLHVRPYIRDAVLSWNTVLERPFLQVADAPPGVTPGDPRYPLIQWVEIGSGTAYGMAIAHPRTGEVLTALITIPDGWALPPRELQDIPAHSADPVPLADGVLCAYRAEPWSAADLRMDGSSPDLRELGLRRLQATVIHEVGHVLGLRHNFAASLDGDATLPASSVMDYLSSADDVRMLAPGPYDRAAVAYLYNNVPLPQDAPLHFCTDADVGTVADCAHWDGGAEPIRWHAEQVEGAAQAVSRWVVSNLIVPADLLDTLRPDQSLLYAHLGRLEGSLKALQSYRTGNAWTLHGLFPYERATMAQAALNQFLASFNPDDVLHTHPLIREPLTSHITTLETQAARDDATGRWATQVLRNIVDRLQYALSLS